MRGYFALFSIIVLFQVEAACQKVDIDNYWVYISCVDLPLNYVPVKDRTFSVQITGSYEFTGSEKEDQINVYGWKKVYDRATLDVIADIGEFKEGKSVTSSRTVETKDKDGNVTARNTYYKVGVTNSVDGELSIYGPKKEMPKFEQKKSKKKEEEETNPFLKNVDVREGVDDNNDENLSKDLVYTYSLDKTYMYEGSEMGSALAAFREFKANAHVQVNNHKTSYRNDYTTWINTYLNNMYGYKPLKNYVRFKRLDSDDHPEFFMFDNATKAMKTIFSKMRYNKSEAEIEKDLQQVVAYFEGIASKYTKNDKQDKKLRAAAYYNLARIYQYLDKHDKAIQTGKAIIASKHDEDDGEDFIRESEELQWKLDFHHMKSRHIVPQNNDQEKDEEGEVSDETRN